MFLRISNLGLNEGWDVYCKPTPVKLIKCLFKPLLFEFRWCSPEGTNHLICTPLPDFLTGIITTVNYIPDVSNPCRIFEYSWAAYSKIKSHQFELQTQQEGAWCRFLFLKGKKARILITGMLMITTVVILKVVFAEENASPSKTDTLNSCLCALFIL